MSNKKKKYLGAAKTKYEMGFGKESPAFADTGYTAICPRCLDRHSINLGCVNQPRFIDFKICIKEECKNYKFSEFEEKYRKVPL